MMNRVNRSGFVRARGGRNSIGVPPIAIVEKLESRSMLSAVAWTGIGGDNAWNTAANWSSNVVPSAGSDVTIAASPASIITGNPAIFIKSLTLTSGQLKLSNSLTVANAISVASGGTLSTNGATLTSLGSLTGTGTIDLTNSTVDLETSLTETSATPKLLISNTTFNGAGTLTIGAGITQSVSSSTFNLPLTNLGTLSVLNLGFSDTPFNGSFSNAATGTLQLQTASNGDGSITVGTGFTNLGKIVLTATTGETATLKVNSGGLLNAVGGVITCQGTGQIQLQGNLTNQGTVTVNASTSLEYYSSLLTNTGTINLNAATTLGYGSTDSLTNHGTINVNATTISYVNTFTNTGIISVAGTRTLTIGSNHTFSTSGTLAGAGTIDLTGATVDLETSLMETSATPKLVISNTTFNGAGTLTIGAGITQSVSSSTFNLPLTNQGTLSVLNLGFSDTPFNGSFSNAATGTLQLQTASNGSGSITVGTGFTNLGKIVLTATTGETATLKVNSGGLLNAVGGVITCQGTGQIQLQANLTNQGTVTVNAPTSLEYYSSLLTNTGTINLNAATTLGYGSTDSLTNHGTINVNAATNSDVNTFTNTGIISVAGARTLTIGSNHTFSTSGTLAGAGTIDLTGATVDLETSLTETSATPKLLISNTTFNGAGTLTIGAGITQSVSSSTFNLPLTNQGTLSVLNLGFSDTPFNGSFSNAATGTLQLQTASNGSGSITIGTGFTNLGKIVLTATTGETANLKVNSGGLLNAVGGVITCQGTGQIQLQANLTNQGTVTVNASTSLEYYSSLLTNTGTINLNAATTLGYGSTDSLTNRGTINVNAATTSDVNTFTNTGTINVASGRTLTVGTNDTFINIGTVNNGVSPSTASIMTIQQSPSTSTAGVASSALKVAVLNHYGNLETTATTVTLTLASGTFSNGLKTAAATTVGGIATFANLIFNTAGSYTVKLTSGALPATSFNVSVNPTVASKVVLTTVPATGTAGTKLTSVVAKIEDAFGNVVTSNTSTTTLSVKSGPGSFASGSTLTAAAVAGVATFTNLTLNAAGVYTLKAASGTLTAVNSGNIVVS